MQVLKRNQIIILVIALMLVSAGYLNFATRQKENAITTSTQDANLQVAGIGDAKLVSSNGIVEQNEQSTITSNNTSNMNENNVNEQNTLTSNNSIGENNLKENQTQATTSTSSTTQDTSNYFSSSRLNRETMYSQMIESYQEILENSSISEAQKTIAQTEIQNINKTKNKIMICENLIKTKNIEDLVIFVNDKSISVIIRADKLEQEQIAQIQNIIAREMETEITNIHISNK